MDKCLKLMSCGNHVGTYFAPTPSYVSLGTCEQRLVKLCKATVGGHEAICWDLPCDFVRKLLWSYGVLFDSCLQKIGRTYLLESNQRSHQLKKGVTQQSEAIVVLRCFRRFRWYFSKFLLQCLFSRENLERIANLQQLGGKIFHLGSWSGCAEASKA